MSFQKERATVSVLIPQTIIDLHEPSIYGYSISINSTGEVLLIYRCWLILQWTLEKRNLTFQYIHKNCYLN